MDSPTLRQLQCFVAVADELHFSRAAERLGIAQPPLTQHIQKLERLLGCRLLVRDRKTQLTEAGTVLAAEARRLLAQANDVFDRTRSVARGEAGRLRVGVPPSVMLTNLPVAIRRYREQYPAVTFTLRELATAAIEEALRAREIDLGFLREARPGPPLESVEFLAEALVAVLPAAHRQASAATLTLAKLKAESFVLFPKRLGAAFHDRLVQACANAGFTPNVVQEATQWQTVVSFVEAGMGVSLAPECVSKFRRPGIVYRSLAHLQTRVYASWPEKDPSPAAARFLKTSSAQWQRAARV